MKINSLKTEKRFTQVNREYIFTSAEIRRTLQIEGEIQFIGLQSGRSPKDIENGKSAETDRWYVKTEEKIIKPNA